MTSHRRQEWAAAPAILWFSAFVVGALAYEDGDIDALAERVTPAGRGDDLPRPQVFGSGPVRVADGEADGDIDNDIDNGGDRDTDPDDPAPASTFATLIENPKAMDAFFRAVGDARAGRLKRPLRVSYYGDSVISTDAVPARVRARLHREFGDGGPGFMWAARPHRFCWHEGLTVTNGGTWKTSMVSTKPAADGLHGLGNATAETTSGTLKLASKTPVSIVDVYYLAQPGGGTADVRVGDARAAIDTASDVKKAGFHRITATAAAKTIRLETAGKVRLFGLVLENATGAVVDNMGIVSATPKNLANNRADHWSAQLAHRDTDLFVIMLGANEAQWLPPTKNAMTEYQSQYEAILAPVRAGIGDSSSCLVVSPLDQAYDAGSGLASRPVLPKLVAAQRAAATAAGCAFFSAYDWAGGKGSALKWRAKKLVGDDFQHLSRRGANKLADAIVDTLLAGAKEFATP